MTTKEIKKFLKETFELKTVRVTSTLTKRPYFTARMPYSRIEGNAAVYDETFVLGFRQLALRVIYGDNCTFADAGNAGNVNSHSIAMHETEWDNLIARWTAEKLTRWEC